MDYMLKNLSLNEAKTLVHKLVNESDIDTIENFWFIELDNIHLSVNDSTIYNRILKMKNENNEVSNVLYNNCIKTNIIHNLINKNWRRLFNNDIVEKYNEYKKNCLVLYLNQGDKVWVMR